MSADEMTAAVETPAEGIIETEQVRNCLRMAEAVMASKTRVGRIIGGPGVGKTTISQRLAEREGSIRICCYAGMSPGDVMVRLARRLGRPTNVTTGQMVADIAEAAGGRLLIFDEANHLGWNHLEKLRYLADEGGAGIVLIGTSLLEETFRDKRGAVYLQQLRRRIGARQVTLHPMDIEDPTDVAAYVIQPRFGKVGKAVARLFAAKSRGLWGDATELADGCARIMQAQGITELCAEVVTSAAADMGAQR